MLTLTPAQRDKIESLLAEMTLEEKIGQMNQESPSIVGDLRSPLASSSRWSPTGGFPMPSSKKL